MTADRPFQIVFEAVLVEDGVHAFLQTIDSAGGAETEVEVDHNITRDDIRCASAAVDIRYLPRSRQVVFIAVIPFLRNQFSHCLLYTSDAADE